MSKQYKWSGATYSKIKKESSAFKGSTIINGWKISKDSGMITVTVKPTKNSSQQDVKLQNGKTKHIQTMLAEIIWHRFGNVQLASAILDTNTMLVTIPKFNMFLSTEGSGTTKGGKKVKGTFNTFSAK